MVEDLFGDTKTSLESETNSNNLTDTRIVIQC